MTTMAPIAEGEIAALLAETAAGERESFSRLYDLTAPRLYGVIRRILPNPAQADDALQECYVKIWQKAGSFRPGQGSALGWLLAIARNQAIDERRRSQGRLQVVQAEPEIDMLADPADQTAQAERRHDMWRLQGCLKALPAERREMIVLAYHQGWSREELSRRFGRPVATVKAILRRSLMALKECLDAA
jgi:RNA polymerase sigma-70 factor (ECF subfamily)